MSFELSKRSINNLYGVNDQLVSVIHRAISITKVDFGIPSNGGLRTPEEQRLLFKGGKSNADGYKVKSKHQRGNAVDVFAYVNGKASYDEFDLSMVACAILQSASELGVKVRWGGHFKTFKDMPHFELIV